MTPKTNDRKLVKKTETGQKKKRWAQKTKRLTRAPAIDATDDAGHNEENHLQQDGSGDEMDGGAGAATHRGGCAFSPPLLL